MSGVYLLYSLASLLLAANSLMRSYGPPHLPALMTIQAQQLSSSEDNTLKEQ
jgi:hypothetical protein